MLESAGSRRYDLYDLPWATLRTESLEHRSCRRAINGFSFWSPQSFVGCTSLTMVIDLGDRSRGLSDSKLRLRARMIPPLRAHLLPTEEVAA
ncbi:MAG: hypothetical protein ACYDGU_08475 [Acidiferrobacterales bacterium]